MKIKLIFLICLSSFLWACDSPSGLLKKGSKAPIVTTKKLVDVDGDLARLTTYRYPDERMYQYSVHEALKMNKTIVLEFATPGHCTVCDKQLQMLKAMLVRYEKDVIFMHMDQYQNPQAFKAFRVVGDPWTFIIDKSGTVQFTRPGRMLYQELDMILKKILKPKAVAKLESDNG